MSKIHSEKNVRKNCPYCDTKSRAFLFALEETKNFYIVCDPNPITEGHILIIPKIHISCVGEYSRELFNDFIEADKKVRVFLNCAYGSATSFEHGKFGQTIFHSHIHYLPFSGKPLLIIPEGAPKIKKVASLSNLIKIFKKDGGYLYFSIGEKKWVVDPSLTVPRFFRDRFAEVLGRPERGNWKLIVENAQARERVEIEAAETQRKWKKFHA
jgi:diadenosine tetraphosphate (Ap4A) HIT family hydrolase